MRRTPGIPFETSGRRRIARAVASSSYKAKPASSLEAIPEGTLSIDTVALTSGDFDSVSGLTISGGQVKATTAGVNGTATKSISTIDTSDFFHIAIAFTIGDNSDGNILKLEVGSDSNFRKRMVVEVCNETGVIEENTYGWSGGQAISNGNYIWFLIGDGTHVSAGIVRADGDPWDWVVGEAADAGFFNGQTNRYAGADIATMQIFGQTQLDSWNRIKIDSSSEENYVTGISLRRGGWGNFSNSTRARHVINSLADSRPYLWLPSDFNPNVTTHQVECHHQNLGTTEGPALRYLWQPLYVEKKAIIYGIQGHDGLGVGGLNDTNVANYKAMNWGSSFAGTAGDTAREIRQEMTDWMNRLAVGARFILGISMGGMNALTFFRVFNEQYDAVILGAPVANLENTYNGGFSANINGAWSVSSYAEVEDEDPMNNGATYSGVPIFLRYSTSDTILDFTDGNDLFSGVANRITVDVRSGSDHLDEATLTDSNNALSSWWDGIGW